MSVMKKLAPVGVAIIAGVSAIVPAAAVGAKSADMKPLATGGNAAISVNTELNCSTHTIVADVTNKTDGKVSPDFTLDKQEVDLPDMSIEPGKSQQFYVPYSGNNKQSELAVSVDGQQDVKMKQNIACSEPVSFMVDKTSDSAVTGYLQNNSSFVSQTVFARVNGSDTRVEELGPGESRLVALPFTPTTSGITKAADGEFDIAFLTIGTSEGFQSTYTVDLDMPIVLPLVALPKEQ